MTTCSSILTWEIPWTEEPCGLQSMGSQRTGYNQGAEHAVCLRYENKSHVDNIAPYIL